MDFEIIKKQPLPRSKQKMNLYKLVVARSDIKAAFETCELFMKTVDNLGHDLYYPLFCSIVICYGRPFSDNEPIGPLPGYWSKFSDKRLQETHDDLISTRNKLVAHSDLDIRKVIIYPPDTHVEKTKLISGNVGVGIRSFYFPLKRFPIIHKTSLDLGHRLNNVIEEEIKKIYGGGMDLPNAPFPLRFDEGL